MGLDQSWKSWGVEVVIIVLSVSTVVVAAVWIIVGEVTVAYIVKVDVIVATSAMATVTIVVSVFFDIFVWLRQSHRSSGQREE